MAKTYAWVVQENDLLWYVVGPDDAPQVFAGPFNYQNEAYAWLDKNPVKEPQPLSADEALAGAYFK